MSKKQAEWFESWFDTSYYHILYKNRDFSEAEEFIHSLLRHLTVKKGEKSLDLGCGMGRHSVLLNQLGLNVTGLDLSPNNIEKAKVFENSTLHFDVHDMRKVYKENTFDFVFNLFTSFGYFEKVEDNINTLKSIHKMLLPDGTVVIDFMNAYKAVKELVVKEEKTLSGIQFNITKEFTGDRIIKSITFEDKGETYSFQEKVQTIQQEDFKKWLEEVGFRDIQWYGNYALEPFNKETSDRLIIIAKKA